MIEKLILEKFKKQLGSQYEVIDNDFFQRNFTTTVPANGQIIPAYRHDTFEKYGNKVIAVLQVQSAPYAVTSFEAINTTYSLSLWVPVNYLMINAKGELLKEPKFNVDRDLRELRLAYNNQTIDFGNGYRGELTFSEPVPVSGVEDTGSYKRKVISITGKINISTKSYFGRDYRIELGRFDGENIDYRVVNNVTSQNFTPTPNSIENHQQGDLVPEENVEAVKEACSFSVDDSYDDEILNETFTTLALSGERSKEPYMLRLSKLKDGEYFVYAEYPVYLIVGLSHPRGTSDSGTFTVSCMRCK